MKKIVNFFSAISFLIAIFLCSFAIKPTYVQNEKFPAIESITSETSNNVVVNNVTPELLDKIVNLNEVEIIAKPIINQSPKPIVKYIKVSKYIAIQPLRVDIQKPTLVEPVQLCDVKLQDTYEYINFEKKFEHLWTRVLSESN